LYDRFESGNDGKVFQNSGGLHEANEGRQTIFKRKVIPVKAEAIFHLAPRILAVHQSCKSGQWPNPQIFMFPGSIGSLGIRYPILNYK